MQGRGNHVLMGNTLLSLVQIALSTTVERGGRHPGGDRRPEMRHNLKTGAQQCHWFPILRKGTIMHFIKSNACVEMEVEEGPASEPRKQKRSKTLEEKKNKK